MMFRLSQLLSECERRAENHDLVKSLFQMTISDSLSCQKQHFDQRHSDCTSLPIDPRFWPSLCEEQRTMLMRDPPFKTSMEEFGPVITELFRLYQVIPKWKNERARKEQKDRVMRESEEMIEETLQHSRIAKSDYVLWNLIIEVVYNAEIDIVRITATVTSYITLMPMQEKTENDRDLNISVVVVTGFEQGLLALTDGRVWPQKEWNAKASTASVKIFPFSSCASPATSRITSSLLLASTRSFRISFTRPL